MAHELEIVNGEAQMFSVKETPWHGLGKIVQEAPTAEEAIKLAGLDWKVEEKQIYSFFGLPGVEYSRIESHKAILRATDRKVLGVVGKDYHPLQNDKAFEFFNPFVESGLASFETAGSLRDGKVIWVLAKLNKAPIEVGRGDAINKYLMLSNGHDGTMAVRVGFTPIRVVCANTLAMSIGSKDARLLRVMHSKQVNTNVERIRELVNAADAKFEATAEQYQELTRHDVNQKDLQKYVEIVFKYSAVEEQRRQMAKDRMIQDITRLFETGRDNDLPGAKGTYWGLYNAVTEYLSWEKGKTSDSRLNSLWFGDAGRLNKFALDAALKSVAA